MLALELAKLPNNGAELPPNAKDCPNEGVDEGVGATAVWAAPWLPPSSSMPISSSPPPPPNSGAGAAALLLPNINPDEDADAEDDDGDAMLPPKTNELAVGDAGVPKENDAAAEDTDVDAGAAKRGV